MTNSRIIPALLLSGLAIASLSLAACNTTEGLGEDVEATGEAIQDEAEDAQQ